jgi:superfamily II DNA/RNA helicase
MSQEARERSMIAFRTGKKDILVATEVAARGIDVDDVTHVINYTVPEDEKAYLHRTGRTGRAGRTGIAITFVDWDDLNRWKHINDALELGVPEPLETYSSSEHLFTDLDIAKGTKGRLVPAKPEERKPQGDRKPQGGNRDRGPRRPQGDKPAGSNAAPRQANPDRQRRRTRGGTQG